MSNKDLEELCSHLSKPEDPLLHNELRIGMYIYWDDSAWERGRYDDEWKKRTGGGMIINFDDKTIILWTDSTYSSSIKQIIDKKIQEQDLYRDHKYVKHAPIPKE